MGTYYNEIDPYAAQWLRNLIAAGHLPAGDVDERSIADVQPDDLRGYTQYHFFSGVGGWAIALRLAGWSDNRPVWTGSCPCQPFSVAGKKAGKSDARHLWPEFSRLIGECRPPVVFGEQVASRDGRDWLSALRADVEGLGYAVGAADLCAAGVGAPHIRQRLYWGALRLPDPDRRKCHGLPGGQGRDSNRPEAGRVQGDGESLGGSAPGVAEGGVVNRISAGLEGHPRHGAGGSEPGRDDAKADGSTPEAGSRNHWGVCDWADFLDGTSRPFKSGACPLDHGVPGGGMAVVLSGSEEPHIYSRKAALMGAGNAIVPQVAAAFVTAFIGCAK